jgi:hypothetical protein
MLYDLQVRGRLRLERTRRALTCIHYTLQRHAEVEQKLACGVRARAVLVSGVARFADFPAFLVGRSHYQAKVDLLLDKHTHHGKHSTPGEDSGAGIRGF